MVDAVHGSAPLFIDLDGTLVDSADRYFATHRRVLDDLGGRAADQATYWALKRRGGSLHETLLQSGFDTDLSDDYLERWLDLIESPPMLALDRLHSGVERVLPRLGERGPLVLVTLRRNRRRLEGQLGQLGLDRHLDLVMSGSADKGSGVGVKLGLILSSGVDTAGGAVVGDTETDIRAGKEAGMSTIGVECGLRNRQVLLAESPNLLVPDVPSLPWLGP